MKSFRDFWDEITEFDKDDELDDVFIVQKSDRETDCLLLEGIWLNAAWDQSIRIDQPTHGSGQTHAHIFGRKGNEIGVVNLDGTPSHGSKFRIPNKLVPTLQNRAFTIPADRFVEFVVVGNSKLLLG